MFQSIVSLRLTRRVFLVVAAFLLLIIGDDGPAVDGCSIPHGWVEPSDIEKVTQAKLVVYGRVRDTYTDEQQSSIYSHVYTADMEIYCIMKGTRTERFINISEAGRPTCVMSHIKHACLVCLIRVCCLPSSAITKIVF